MDTSGVVVFAKTPTCQKALQAKFRDKKEDDSLLKEYHALLCGHLDVDVVDGNNDEYEERCGVEYDVSAFAQGDPQLRS